MTEYRSREENRAQADAEAAIAKVLDQAIRDGARLNVAIYLREPVNVVERCLNTLWDGLRDNLTDVRGGGPGGEQRLTAIVMLLRPHIDAHAAQLVKALQD